MPSKLMSHCYHLANHEIPSNVPGHRLRHCQRRRKCDEQHSTRHQRHENHEGSAVMQREPDLLRLITTT